MHTHIPKSNCSIQSYAPVLTAWKEFGPSQVTVTTYQAISGAGKTFQDWPEMVENIVYEDVTFSFGERVLYKNFSCIFEAGKSYVIRMIRFIWDLSSG